MLNERLIRRLTELQTAIKLEYLYVFPPTGGACRRGLMDSLSKLFDAAPLPMMLCAFPGGGVRHANRRAAELFIAGRELNSCHIEDLLGEESSRQFEKRLQDSGGFVDDFEAMLQTPYGESFPAMVSGQLMFSAPTASI